MSDSYFAAIMAPQSVRDKFAPLAGVMPKDWQIKNPDNYHFSLAYLQDLNGRRPSDLSDIFKRAANQFQKDAEQAYIPLGMEGLSYFTNHTPPAKARKWKDIPKHILYARPSHDAANDMITLHNKIISLLRKHGYPFGLTQINPHMTLAKIPQDQTDAMEAFERKHGVLKSAMEPVRSFGLYRTIPGETAEQLRKSGRMEPPKYELIEEFALDI